MHFADWPVWARPKDEKAPIFVPTLPPDEGSREIMRALEDGTLPTLEQVAAPRKKPGPKPKAKP